MNTARIVAIMAVGVLATTLTVAARHRHHNTQHPPWTGDSNQAKGDKGSANPDVPKDGKSPPSGTGGDPTGSRGKDDPLDLRITVFQGRGRNLHTSKDAHDPKGGLTDKPYVLTTPPYSTDHDGHTGHPIHHQPKFLANSRNGTHRNAVGALIGKAGNPSANGSGTGRWNGERKPHNAAPLNNPANPENVGEHLIVHLGSDSGGHKTEGPVINGVAMIHHPWSGTGAVGGPVKLVSGTLNGSAFRSRHP
jgi:hypothetical protein